MTQSQEDPSSSPLTEYVAREERLSSVLSTHSSDGCVVWGRLAVWVIQDGYGGCCLVPFSRVMGSAVGEVLKIWTGETDRSAALTAYNSRARYPHLSEATMAARLCHMHALYDAADAAIPL